MFFLFLLACMEYGFQEPEEREIIDGIPSVIEDVYISEEFANEDKDNVDILFVIDRSCSMWDNIIDLNNNMYKFLDTLDEFNINYRVGVMSADAQYAGQGGRVSAYNGYNYVTPSTVNPDGVLAGLISASPGAGEQGIETMWRAISQDGELDHNQIFFRPLAPLHFVMISDEHDSSPDVGPFKLLHRISDYRNEKRADITISTVTHKLPTFSRCADSGASMGYEYLQVARALGGIQIDICDPNWTAALEELALYAIPDPEYEYVLKDIPVEDTIMVYVERSGALIDYSHVSIGGERGHVYDEVRNSVTLTDYTFIDDDRVLVEYMLKR